MARTPYCFSTLSFSCLKQASILSWNGLSASVTLSPWILIPSAKNGICKTQIRPPEFSVHGLGQRCPAPRPRTGTGPWPARNRAARQEASGGGDGEAPAALAAAPQHRPHRLGSFGVACSEERSPWGCPRRLGTAGRGCAGAGRWGGSTHPAAGGAARSSTCRRQRQSGRTCVALRWPRSEVGIVWILHWPHLGWRSAPGGRGAALPDSRLSVRPERTCPCVSLGSSGRGLIHQQRATSPRKGFRAKHFACVGN